eukprot:TRINITY_DN3491_c0_g1_i2.p1 TRINITY_DN3491_c0_g1~~TRINITY_DN3491_c0_g1_i2.p1  ORF type:complete len:533 (-),score=199.14 TRINITY_DN3491_c0_g1_i2:1764-3362(-)
MRRSASRVRRSVSHRGKTAAKFQFDVTVASVTGVKEGNTYFIKWSRGVKVASTKPRTADKGAAKKGGPGQPVHEKLSLLCTLFRDGGIAKSTAFEEKEAKLSLISVAPGKKGSEKTVAKTHFNLAAFAGIPSASERKVFALSDRVAVTAVVDCKFLSNASAKASYAGSAMSGLSGVTSLAGGSSSEEEDDFADLDVGDVPDPLGSTPSPVGAGPSPPPSASVAPTVPAVAAAPASLPVAPPTPPTPAAAVTPTTPASAKASRTLSASKKAERGASAEKDGKEAKAEKPDKGDKAPKGGTVAPSRSRLGLLKRSASKKEPSPKPPRGGAKADAGPGEEGTPEKAKHRSLGGLRKDKDKAAAKADKAADKADKADKGAPDKRPGLFRKDKEAKAAKAEALDALRGEVAAAQSENVRLQAQLSTAMAGAPADAVAAVTRECEAQEAVLEATNARRAALQLVQDNLLREGDAHRAELDALTAQLAAAGVGGRRPPAPPTRRSSPSSPPKRRARPSSRPPSPPPTLKLRRTSPTRPA